MPNNKMNVHDEILAFRQKGGFCLLPQYRLVEVTGPDAAKFLQARVSNDVNALSDGQSHMTALLDRKAYFIAYFLLQRVNAERFVIMLEESQLATVLDHFEKFHFRENLEYRIIKVPLSTVQGARSVLLSFKDFPVVIKHSLTGDDGFIVAGDISEQCEALNMVPLSAAAMEVARIEAGIPVWGKDFGEAFVMPETALENTAASYSKGCFPGQEVLARVRTYGAPKRGLVGLRLSHPVSSTQLHSTSGEPIATVTSWTVSPTFKCVIALAYVERTLRVPDTTFAFKYEGDNTEYSATVCTLPTYSPDERRKQAKEIYDRALSEFTTGSESTAIEQLREALTLDPVFADAYEALGVALSRQESPSALDEAIELMKQLERLDPDSIMAHANLSVFYMQKGDKEAAEEEKAKAMSIRMSQMAKDYAAQQQKEAEAKKRKAEADQRISMFSQVLAIDPDDFLANSGMGSALVDLEKHAEALPFLQKALGVRPTHTVAYLTLAEAHEKLGQLDQAIAVYKRGIQIAAQRGDLTPMKEMQSHLDRLTAQPIK